MGIFSKPVFTSDKKRELPAGLWTKCPSCGEIIHNLELERNLRICIKCDHHFALTARDRLDLLLDEGSFEEHDAKLTSLRQYIEREVAALRAEHGQQSDQSKKKPWLEIILGIVAAIGGGYGATK